MTDDHLDRLDLLILARLATYKKPPSVGKLEQELFVFVEARLSRREWSSSLKRRLEALRKSGALDHRRVPTPRGLERLREALGVRSLPDRWPKIWRALMPALALEVSGARWADVATPDALRARLIRQEHELELPQTPTLTQAVDAQAWQALGFDETGPLTLGRLRRALLERALDSSLRNKSIDIARAGQWLATMAAGTTTRDIAAIQRALVRRWLFEADAPTEATSPPKLAKLLPPTGDRTPLPRWAEQVLAVAQATERGRYGEERVFIAAVWHAVQSGPAPLRGPLAAFKERLIEANRAGLLRLHRADLVGAMDEQLVRESETQHLNATFHFIEITPRSKS